MGRGSLLLTSTITALIMVGCSSKQYYHPEQVKSGYTDNISDEIRFLSRDGANLSSGLALTPKFELDLNLKGGEMFINRSPYGSVIATKSKKSIILRGSRREEITLPKPLVAGTVVKDRLIYLLKDNSYGVYNLKSREIEFNDKSQVIYSIDSRVANPILVDNYIVIPLLNGKLGVLI